MKELIAQSGFSSKLVKVFSLLVLGFASWQTQAQESKHQFLLFWRSDCGHCSAAIREVVAKTAKLNQDRFTLTTISFDTDSILYFNAIRQNRMEGFVNQYNFKQGYVDNPLAKKYGVTHTPTLLYIDERGNVLAEMQEAYKKLLSLKE